MLSLKGTERRLGPAMAGCVVILVAGFLLCRSLGAASAAPQPEDTVRFKWAFGSVVGNSDNSKLEPIVQDTVLKTGDKLKMMVQLGRKCFVYVLYQNSQGEITLLFPYTLKQFEADYEVSKPYLIPRGDAWFQLDDNIGKEAFYLLASDQRLSEVEYLFNLYESADPAKKKQIASQMLAEIRHVENQQREFALAAQRPIPIGGVIRGMERALGQDPSDISTIAYEVSSTDFFTKTFTIDHR